MSRIFNADHGLMRWRKSRTWIIACLIILCALEISGCSMMGKPPTEALANAELGLRAASEARAAEFAPMDLQSAREKLEGSKQAIAAKRYEDARRLAESGQVEAELAEVQAETEGMGPAAARGKSRQSLEQAERAWTKERDVTGAEYLSYVAERRVEIARATARRRLAADEIQPLKSRRE